MRVVREGQDLRQLRLDRERAEREQAEQRKLQAKIEGGWEPRNPNRFNEDRRPAPVPPLIQPPATPPIPLSATPTARYGANKEEGRQAEFRRVLPQWRATLFSFLEPLTLPERASHFSCSAETILMCEEASPL
jgi:hypothetical protein